MKKLLSLAIIVVLASLPLWALATHADVQDENDVRGLLDVKFVKVTGDEKPRWEFITFGEWTTEDIWDRGFGLVYFDTGGDDRFDKYALVRSDGFGLKASLWRDREEGQDVKISNLEVFRRNQKSMTVKVPFRKLGIPDRRDFYRWFAETLFTGNNCRRVCIDRVPDEGSVFEPLEPDPTPTVTPTASPTVTPSTSPSSSPSP